MPTIPAHREGQTSAATSRASSARGSVSRTPGLRSGDVTPSSPTRPLSALSQVSSASTTVATIGHHVRARTAPAGGRKPRPVSIAVTGLSVSEAARAARSSRESVGRDRSKEVKENEKDKEKEKEKDKDKTTERRKTRPLSAPRQPRARSADMRPESSNVSSASSTASSRSKAAVPASPSSKVSPTSEHSKTPIVPSRKKSVSDKGKPQTPRTKSEQSQTPASADQTEDVKTTPEETKENEAPQIQVQSADEEAADHSGHVDLLAETPVSLESADASETVLLTDSSTTPTECREAAPEAAVPEEEARSSLETTPSESCPSDAQSQGQRKIISSEEEAKAALAEKRRLIREEKEREAERERIRLEEEQRREEERRRQEELEQKLAEEEMDRLAQEARKAEEERLQKAIEETRRREEEERIRREEEARMRAEKEQQEKKAREDAERLRKETEERLALQEKERQERKKRVDAIMSRTRGKSGSTSNAGVPGTIVGGNKPNDLLLSAATTPTELSTSQPDLLGDLVNKSLATPNGQNEIQQRTNGFYDTQTDSNGSSTGALPDISVIANADSVNSNANNGNIVDESVDLLA